MGVAMKTESKPFCGKCGARRVDAADKFCPDCGTSYPGGTATAPAQPLSEASVPAAPPVTPPEELPRTAGVPTKPRASAAPQAEPVSVRIDSPAETKYSWEKLFTFKGKASRGEYAAVQVFILAFFLIALVASAALDATALFYLSLPIPVMNLSLTTARLRDMGENPNKILFIFVPVLGSLGLAIWCLVTPSKKT
jgi:hypothetical protein